MTSHSKKSLHAADHSHLSRPWRVLAHREVRANLIVISLIRIEQMAQMPDGITAPFVIDAPMNGEIFVTYLQQCVVPTLSPGEIVSMDNLPAHKVAAVRETIEATGAELRLLPAYSPDLNPIEQSFAKLKAHLRKAGERSVPALWDRIGTILQTFTPQECKNFFTHAGYGSN